MDFVCGGSGSGDEQISSSRKGKKPYNRHSAQQIQQLESYFKECPHPDENQRRQLSNELGLDPKQIKFWFQNKRTQTKVQNEKADNNALRAENERIHCENLAIQEALKSVKCAACSGSDIGEEERQHNLQLLRMENSRLKSEYERIISLFSNSMGNSSTPPPGNEPFSHIPVTPSLGEATRVGPSFNLERAPQDLQNHPLAASTNMELNSRAMPSYPFMGGHDMDKTSILETAVSAMDELLELLRVEEPVWIKSTTDGRCHLHRDSYDKLFPKPSHFKSASARMESSKYSGEVAMTALHLIEILADSNKWKDMFPNIVTKARTLELLDTGGFGGALYMMYEKMHILSPLVAPREFFFIRYCRQLNLSTWLMVDVSYDFIKELQDAAPTRSWKLPSGCMIEDMSNGKSTVTWIEHVQVDDRSLTHRLYRDLVCACQAYGAKRWITTLQRMSERLAFSMGLTIAPKHELEDVIDSIDGRRNLMRLCHRMVNNFCEVLGMSDKLNFPHLAELNNSGVRVSLRRSEGPGQPQGLIVSAATSLWLPISIEGLFNFLKDDKKRAQWDVLSSGNPVSEIARVSTGTNPGNCISIIQPFIPKESNMLMLQESCIDSLGAMIIYAPMDLQAITAVVGGKDTAQVQILPSGYVISSDGRVDRGIGTSSSSSKTVNGSLLTVSFQILVCCSTLSKQVNMESVATVHTLISSTIQKMKVALDCSDLD